MTTRCEYIFTYADFLESLRVYRKTIHKAQAGYDLYVWIIPAILGLCSVAYCLLWARGQAEPGSAELFLLTLAAAIAVALPLRYRVSLRRAFDQRDRLAQGKPMFFEFDEAVTRFIIPGGAETSYSLKSFTHFSEGQVVALLFVGSAAFHTIPKRAMDEVGWNRLRILLPNTVKRATC